LNSETPEYEARVLLNYSIQFVPTEDENLTTSGKYPVQIKADELSRLRNYKAFISPLRLMSVVYTCHKEPPNSRHQKGNMKLVLYQG
jgi:hypothetical protein